MIRPSHEIRIGSPELPRAYWILVVQDQPAHGRRLSAQEVASDRFHRRYWILGRGARGKRQLKAGDLALVYAGGATASFLGFCEIVAPRAKQIPSIGGPKRGITYVHLGMVYLFSQSVAIRTILDQLAFIRDKRRWGCFLQGSAIRIPQPDFQQVLTAAGLGRAAEPLQAVPSHEQNTPASEERSVGNGGELSLPPPAPSSRHPALPARSFARFQRGINSP